MFYSFVKLVLFAFYSTVMSNFTETNHFTVLVIEDEPAIQKELKYLIAQEPDAQLLACCDNVVDARQLILSLQPNVVLVDIQLRDGTAFDLLKKLDHIPENIIFITAYNQFAIKAVKYGALDYLLKPIEQDELKEAFDRYRRKKELNPQWMQQINVAQQALDNAVNLPETIALSSLNKVRIVNVSDIVYCKGDGPYTFFFFKNGEKELVSKPLKHFEDLLPMPFFLRSHQSYLVNRAYISGISKSEYILLNTNEEIPVSTRRRSFILNQLMSK